MKKVLIIEDNLEIRENTAEILELKGFAVISAQDGKAGIAMAKEEKPDVILCDIMMPGVDGYQVIGELKNNPLTASIPFIYTTAMTEQREVKLGMALGATGYVRKPFNISELIGLINRCVK